MEKNGHVVPDLREYPVNRNKFPWEELEKYRGQYVAFSLDGKRILASGKTPEELDSNLTALGIDLSQVVGDHIDETSNSEEDEWAPPPWWQETAMDTKGLPVPDLSEYNENRWKFPLEEQAKYAGMQVAFSLDGKRILASGPDWKTLREELTRQGLHFSQVVVSYVDPL